MRSAADSPERVVFEGVFAAAVTRLDDVSNIELGELRA
jgi:hypothetical protein